MDCRFVTEPEGEVRLVQDTAQTALPQNSCCRAPWGPSSFQRWCPRPCLSGDLKPPPPSKLPHGGALLPAPLPSAATPSFSIRWSRVCRVKLILRDWTELYPAGPCPLAFSTASGGTRPAQPCRGPGAAEGLGDEGRTGGRSSGLGRVAALREAVRPAHTRSHGELGDLRRVVEGNCPFHGGRREQGTGAEVVLGGNALWPGQASVPGDLGGSPTGRWSLGFTPTCGPGEGAGAWQRRGLWEGRQ